MVSARDRNVALGEFLRSRRGAFDPGLLAMPSYGRRRVPGIRREELALLAGVSVSYYTRIEQGAVTASASVLEAIATALRLDQEDRAQMYRLSRAGRETTEPEQLADTLQLVLRTIQETPVGVLGRSMSLLGWNRLAHAVFADHLPFETPWAEDGSANWARLLFLDDKVRGRFAEWAVQARDIVGRLRTSQARHPGDPQIEALVGELSTASPEFGALWSAHPVRERSLGLVRLAHPRLGDLLLRDTVLRPAEDDDQLLILFHAEPGSSSERKLSELRRTVGLGL
ncbi:helix-turn-helix domain-containing protein [Paractinoplanes lichenicola]|uniref:Helix-turn-helix transcriptional regulator n=1 Tax=Paractinoplanes lichenicola TaxID=2802976 RepID=A0ABS1VT30_9ACTN|nr:helix-turn-helix transcriptional regulator [Actinoplanes lichenicola]MBL7257622.1 helix-turn-helix transcriptional regulator [Actinoplanes lichenicola]